MTILLHRIVLDVPTETLGKAIEAVTPFLGAGTLSVSTLTAPAPSPKTAEPRARFVRKGTPRVTGPLPIERTATAQIVLRELIRGPATAHNLKIAVASQGFAETTAGAVTSKLRNAGCVVRTEDDSAWMLTERGRSAVTAEGPSA